MAFSSYQFFLFFPLVVSIYYSLAHRLRSRFLLLASAFFYICFRPESIIILSASVIIDYFIAIKIQTAGPQTLKKNLLLLGLFHNLFLLGFFKYFNFFSGWTGLKLFFPIGISYYTFKKIGYLIDVFRGHMEPETDLATFALYVSFFPAIMAGPIDGPGT